MDDISNWIDRHLTLVRTSLSFTVVFTTLLLLKRSKFARKITSVEQVYPPQKLGGMLFLDKGRIKFNHIPPIYRLFSTPSAKTIPESTLELKWIGIETQEFSQIHGKMAKIYVYKNDGKRLHSLIKTRMSLYSNLRDPALALLEQGKAALDEQELVKCSVQKFVINRYKRAAKGPGFIKRFFISRL